MIGNKFKWAFERVTQYSYTIGDDLDTEIMALMLLGLGPFISIAGGSELDDDKRTLLHCVHESCGLSVDMEDFSRDAMKRDPEDCKPCDLYVRGSDLYQSVLIMQDADPKQGKVSPEQHKYWRYVAPVRSYFDWLPEKIATTFCSTALEAFSGRKYGELEHLEEMDNPRYASMCFQNIYHIGDAKSGQELEVFLTMPLERLRLGCGIQCTETMLPLGPNQRPRLYAAALKLLRFALRLDQARFCSEAEEALGKAMRPFLQLQDEHVLATLSAVVLALKEGRIGLPIGGVFGAGKTRSAAVLLAGLLVYDPSLKLMVVTKENVAAHAIAEHLVALQLPQEVQQLMGRLVGYYEQRRKGSGTPLDLPVENRNHHIRQKSLLIGCGGGFLQECGQPYSPVCDWIKQVDLVLEDEGQQYGNMEEAATIARTPRTCFEIWSGDHRQTPGGLQQTEEAKKFRRKLLKRGKSRSPLKCRRLP